jgi:uncharacterized membrane protein
MKFIVGAMLTTFGIFWGGEGVGVAWPGADLAIVGILVFVSLVALGLVAAFRRRLPVPVSTATALAEPGE